MKNRFFIRLCLTALVLFGATDVFAINIGKPEPTEENLVVGYAYEPEIKWTSSNPIMPDLKVLQHTTYAQLNFVHNPFLATYVRLGGFELNMDDVFYVPGEEVPTEFSPGTSLLATIGFNGLLVKYKHFSLGVFGQYTLCEDYDQRVTYQQSDKVSDTATLSFALKNISWYKTGVGAQTNIGNFTLYGGTFAFGLTADATASKYVFNLNDDLTMSSYENKTSTGTFLGLRLPLDENFIVCLEAQKIDDVSYGVSFNIKFD